MTGIEDYNYPLFNETAETLRNQGIEVYNPAEFVQKNGIKDLSKFPIKIAFAEYCDYICNHADAILMLPGYENSEGAKVELSLAKVCGLKVINYEN